MTTEPNDDKTITIIENKNLDVEIQARDVKWRAQAKVLADENANLKSNIEKEKLEFSSKLESSTNVQKELQKKVIAAEIKAEAVLAGMKDTDFIKMIDMNSIVIKEDGTVDGIKKAIEDLKASKPILFGEEKKSSSSKGEKMPENEKESVLDAFTMSPDQYALERRKLGLY